MRLGVIVILRVFGLRLFVVGLLYVGLGHLLEVEVVVNEHGHILGVAASDQIRGLVAVLVVWAQSLELLGIVLELSQMVRANLRQNVGQQLLDLVRRVISGNNERVR